MPLPLPPYIQRGILRALTNHKTMGNFRKMHGNSNRGGSNNNRGGGGFGGRRPGGQGGFDAGRREMFPATCANCGKPCQVPFRPSGEKPVYCSDCFGNPKLHGGNNSAPREFSGEQPFKAPEKDTRIDDLKRHIDAMTSKLDRVIQILEAGARPQTSTQPKEAPMVVAVAKTKTKVTAPKKVIKKKK